MAVATPAVKGAVPARVEGKPASHYVGLILRYTLLIGIGIVLFTPFILAGIGSFKTDSEIIAWPPKFFPAEWLSGNWAKVWNTNLGEGATFPRWLFNTAVLSVGVAVLEVIGCSMAAYAFARMRFKGKDLMFALFLSTTMISTQVTLVPSYLVMKTLGWIDTYKALIVPFLTSPFAIFTMRQSFMTIPRELEEAARLDGCGRVRFLVQMLLPLCKPVIAAQALFAFMGNWNSYMWPLIITTSKDLRTLQIGLRYFVNQEGGTQWGLFMAAAVLVSVPVIVIYFTVQKQFVEGIATTGLKGT